VAGRFEERRDLWPRERLVTFMRSLGGTPDEMLRDADLVDYMVEILRSDLIVVDTYEYVERPPLGVPLSVFSGEQDPLTAKDLVEGWGQYCTEPVTFHSLPGGHFFLFDQVERFTQCLIKDIGKVLAARRVDEGTGACFLPRKVPVPMNPEP
jgi:surfactin synthase thioesterase subunit